jgi:putative transposase
VARDVSELWPTAVYVSDGHCFDAEVAHPRHGRPFRPEVTTVIDVFTRRIVGWALGLSENSWDVTAAAGNAIPTAGDCDIWYADRGRGFNNHLWDDNLTGLIARLSITKTNALPYGSQARGVIERSHQSALVCAAKLLPTYMGAAMDAEARQRAFQTHPPRDQGHRQIP